jgi:hypothetical protein
MEGVALKGLTVDFHEPGFVSTLNSENQQPFWFEMSREQKQQAGSPWGPANPQALNRYAYVQNNPLRWTDPSGHKRVAAGYSYDEVSSSERDLIPDSSDAKVDSNGNVYRGPEDDREYAYKTCNEMTGVCKYVWGNDPAFKYGIKAVIDNLIDPLTNGAFLLTVGGAAWMCMKTPNVICLGAEAVIAIALAFKTIGDAKVSMRQAFNDIRSPSISRRGRR